MKNPRFGDFEDEYYEYNNAKIAILSVPYDGTSTWIKGADKGPQAIFEVSPNMEFYDIETDSEVYKHGIATVDAVTEASSVKAMVDAVELAFDKMLGDEKFPVMLGGEHSVTIGALRSIAKHCKDFSVLQFDAHSDMRDEYEGSPYNHACVMARAKELTDSWAQVGIRSTAMEERHNVDVTRTFHAYQIRETENNSWMYEVSECLKDDVYITIDLDAFDPAYVPATGTPEPGGLNYREVLNLIRLVNERHNIIGLDIVELCPIEGTKVSEFFAAKLLYQILSIRFKEETI